MTIAQQICEGRIARDGCRTHVFLRDINKQQIGIGAYMENNEPTITVAEAHEKFKHLISGAMLQADTCSILWFALAYHRAPMQLARHWYLAVKTRSS